MQNTIIRLNWLFLGLNVLFYGGDFALIFITKVGVPIVIYAIPYGILTLLQWTSIAIRITASKFRVFEISYIVLILDPFALALFIKTRSITNIVVYPAFDLIALMLVFGKIFLLDQMFPQKLREPLV